MIFLQMPKWFWLFGTTLISGKKVSMATCIRFEFNDYEFHDMNKNFFFFQEYSRLGNPGYFFLSRMMNYGLMGQKLHLMEKLAYQAFDEVMETKRPKKTFYTWQAHCEFSQTVFHNVYYIKFVTWQLVGINKWSIQFLV